MSGDVERVRLVIVPGLGGSDEDHWQSRWEHDDEWEVVRVPVPDWDRPDLPRWLAAVGVVATPDAVLVCHSLGCLAATMWLDADPARRVAGLFLVAVPDPAAAPFPSQAAGFVVVDEPLRSPSVAVASSDDPCSTIERTRELAALWETPVIELPELGHINVESGVGDWPEGRRLLRAFLAGVRSADGLGVGRGVGQRVQRRAHPRS